MATAACNTVIHFVSREDLRDANDFGQLGEVLHKALKAPLPLDSVCEIRLLVVDEDEMPNPDFVKEDQR